ncbi:MAG: T9SS type A sorting domain-containing protein [Flavobacteriia bacterium]|jgi:hypothetical protein|nr:T9SS type A sorting domain-containing protein [Cryomorphaceae bacterium]
MKKGLMACALCLSTIAFAQEEQHLQGSSTEAKEQTNEIFKMTNRIESAAVVVRVFPNPSSGDFTIVGPEGSQVTVYSDLGTYVGTWSIGAEGSVFLDQMPSGVFICTVLIAGERHVRRVVVM